MQYINKTRLAMVFAFVGVVTTLTISHFAPSIHAQNSMSGQWIIEPAGKTDYVQLTLEQRSGPEHNFSSSFPIQMETLKGLSAAQMSSTGNAVKFEIVRDAGAFLCDGWFNGGHGAGHFTFAPNQGYVSELNAHGYKDIDAERTLSLAVHDVSLAFIQDLQSLGYDHLSLDQLIAMRIHGVSTDFIKQLNSLGYNHVSPDDLIAMRIHGVKIEWINELKTLGYDHIDIDRLVAMRIHGVSTEFIKEWKALGYENSSTDQLVAMRIHGVDSDFVKELHDLGYSSLPADELVAMKIHGVKTDFIKNLKNLGYDHVPPMNWWRCEFTALRLNISKRCNRTDYKICPSTN